MKKSEILEYGKTCNFELDKEVKDLSGNTFFSLRNPTTDLTPKHVEHLKKTFRNLRSIRNVYECEATV